MTSLRGVARALRISGVRSDRLRCFLNFVRIIAFAQTCRQMSGHVRESPQRVLHIEIAHSAQHSPYRLIRYANGARLPHRSVSFLPSQCLLPFRKNVEKLLVVPVV
jgi:hypothetical protein